MKSFYLITMVVIFQAKIFSQQIPDTTFNPTIPNPQYELGKGSIILIDEGHNNYHTKNGRYLAFTRLLQQDGYVVNVHNGEFSQVSLSKGKVLVIANALNKINSDNHNWTLPTPSAFSQTEIEILRRWVSDGGSLFLIADHMPWPGAAKDLAMIFGFKFSNGFSIDTVADPTFQFNVDKQSNLAYFKLQDKTLIKSVITTGKNNDERVTQIPNTEGQAFEIPKDAIPILMFNKNCIQLMPDTAWQFNKSTPRFNLNGWYQGAYKSFDKGKIVVFGEASMFSAQLQGPEKKKMGMNRDDAKDNYKLLLNVIHWLDGRL